MIVGDNLQLNATVSPIDATNQSITWVSDQPRTASVNSNGFVSTGPAYGDVTISAFTQDGHFIASCAINVNPVTVNIPAVIEAENYIKMFGIVLEEGGTDMNVGFIDDRDYMDYSVTVSSTAIFTIDYVYANRFQDSEVTLINENGHILDVLPLAKTEEWFDYDTLTSNPFVLLPGEHFLRIECSIGGMNLDWIEFKSDIPLLSSYTFLGTTDNQYMVEANWDGGKVPPNGYNGLITIQADCVLPAEFAFLLNTNGQLVVSQNIEFKIE